MKTRVAIVDDHAIVRMGLKYALSLEDDMEFAGEADDGRTIIDLLKTARPDVLLLDIRMPGPSGVEVLKSVRRVAPGVKVIMLTTSDADDDIYQSLNAGAVGYIIKDRDSDQIIEAIHRVMQGGRFVPRAVEELYKERQMTPDLTPRELEILQMVANGCTNVEVGKLLDISSETVKLHLKHIFDKLDVEDRVSAVTEAIRRGFVKQ